MGFWKLVMHQQALIGWRSRVCEHAEVDAVARVHRDFHGLEFQAFQHLQAGIERRGFDGHQVARFGHGLQAQVQRFQGAVGDQQFFHGQHQPADHVAQGDLPTQLRVARRHVGDHHARVHLAAGAGQRADRRCSGNRVGLGNAEPKGTVFGSLIESRTENTSSLTSTSVDSLTWLLITGSENGRGAWALTK
jgi:hypothetical protein